MNRIADKRHVPYEHVSKPFILFHGIIHMYNYNCFSLIRLCKYRFRHNLKVLRKPYQQDTRSICIHHFYLTSSEGVSYGQLQFHCMQCLLPWTN